MAGVLSRFSLATESTIQHLQDSSKNANTAKSTLFWLRVWKQWCCEKKISDEIEKYEPVDLNNLLKCFYAEVKNQQGEDYEPDSLKVMITSLDRHLKERGYTFSIIRDREFTTSKQVLEGKAKLLRESGRGKRPNKARQLSQEEEEILWEKEKLGSKTPETLVQTMWWLLTQYFGLRGRQEHHQMKMDDFSIVQADNGVSYIQYKEGPTKTRQGGLNCKPRNFQPRMFQTGGQRCPVALFREYVSRRPLNLQQTGPFYLSVKTNRRADDHIWYKVQPMGVNKIDSMMKNIVFGTSLECSGKKFSNHSARKTVVGKLKKANLERSDIAKVTGHRNIQSLDDYDEADEQEQRNLSLAISRRNNKAEEQPRSSSIANIMSKQSTMNSQAHNMINTFRGCNVTFNLSNKSPVSTANQSRKRRFHIIESDSDSD